MFARRGKICRVTRFVRTRHAVSLREETRLICTDNQKVSSPQPYMARGLARADVNRFAPSRFIREGTQALPYSP